MNMMPTRLSGLAVLTFLGLLVLFVLMPIGAGVRAQDSPRECVGLDIVFLVDQSTSMTENDRFGLRSSAVDTAIDILGDNAIYFCPGSQHRVAVLGFGAASDVHGPTSAYVPSQVISGTIDTLDDWKLTREAAKSQIPDADNLGGTDHLSALQSATEILQSWQSNPLDEGPRKRGVVLITDGGPCIRVANNQCVWEGTGFRSQREYLSAIDAYANGPDFPWRGEGNPNSVFLWMIAFNDTTNPNYDYLSDQNVLNTWNSVTDNHGGDLLLLARGTEAQTANAELTGVVANILDPILGSNLRAWECREPIWINPYLSDVTIVHIFRRGANPGVALNDVRVQIVAKQGESEIAEFSVGRTVSGTAEVGDYTRDGPNERYVLYLPPPGAYYVQTEDADLCADLDVRIGETGVELGTQQPATNAAFSQVDEEPYYDVVSSPQFKIQLLQPGRGDTLVPLREQPGFPLTVTVRVRSAPDVIPAVEATYELKRTDNENAIYEAIDKDTGNAKYIETRYPGLYNWELTAVTNNPKRLDATNPITTPLVVLQRAGTYSVAPVERFGFKVMEPSQGDVVLANNIAADGTKIPVPIRVAIQLIDESGAPLDPSSVLESEDADTFSISVLDSAGKVLEKSTIRPVFGQPTLSAEIRNIPTSQSPDPPGSYELDVRLLGNYRTGKYRPNISQQRVQFDRSEVKSIDISIVQPAEGERLPLIDGVAPSLLRAEAQLVDDLGNPVDPAAFTPTTAATPLSAALVDTKGNVLSSAPMRVLTGTKNLVAELGSGRANPREYAPDCYRVRIELTDDYQSEVFQPLGRQQENNFCMQAVEQFVWHIIEPVTSTYPIYPTLGWFSKPRDVPVVVQVKSSNDQLIPSNEIMRPGANSLFNAQLRVPGSGVAYDIDLVPGEKLGEFVGEWPADADSRGKYTLEIALNDENLSAAWVPVDGSLQTRTFERNHGLLNMPWSLMAIIILGVLAAIIGTLAVLSMGPLAGVVLVFSKGDPPRDTPIGEVSASGRLNRRHHRVKKKQLDEAVPSLNLDSIEIDSVKPDEGSGARFAANVTLKWKGEEGEPENVVPLDMLNEGENPRIFRDIRLRLEKRPVSRVPVWLIAFIVGTLGLWTFVVGFLYLAA